VDQAILDRQVRPKIKECYVMRQVVGKHELQKLSKDKEDYKILFWAVKN
jgi:hypothetical protein